MKRFLKEFIKRIIVLLLVIAQLLPVYNIPAAHAADKKDSKIRFNDFYGEVKIRPDSEEDDSYEFVDLDTVIYEGDRIKTEEDSGAILGLEDMSTYVIKPESTLIIHTDEGNVSKIEMLAGSMWGNIKKMAEGKSLEVEMSQCVCGINGTTIYAQTSVPVQGKLDLNKIKNDADQIKEQVDKMQKDLENATTLREGDDPIIYLDSDRLKNKFIEPQMPTLDNPQLKTNDKIQELQQPVVTDWISIVKDNKTQILQRDQITQVQTFDQKQEEIPQLDQMPQLITLDQKQDEELQLNQLPKLKTNDQTQEEIPQLDRMPQVQTFDQVNTEPKQQTEMEKVLASLPKTQPIELKYSPKELEALHNVFNKNNNNSGKSSEEEKKEQELEQAKIIISDVGEAKIIISDDKRKNVNLTTEQKTNRSEVEFLELKEPIAKMYLFDLKSKVSYDNKRTWQTEELKESPTVKPDFLEEKQPLTQQNIQLLDGKVRPQNMAQMGNRTDTVKVLKGTATITNKATKETFKVPAGNQATIAGNVVKVEPIINLEKDQNELNQQLDRSNDKQSTKQLIDKLNGQTGQINDSKKPVDNMLDTIKKLLDGNSPADKIKQASSAYTKAVEEGKRFVSIFVEVNSTINVLSKRISADSVMVVSSDESEAAADAIKKANEAMNSFSQSLEALVGYADKIEEKTGTNPLDSLTSQAENANEIKETIVSSNGEIDEVTKGITDESSYSDFKNAITRCEALLRDLQNLNERLTVSEVGTEALAALKKQFLGVYLKVEKAIKDYSSVPEIKTATLKQMNDFENDVPGFSSDIRKYLKEYKSINSSSTDAKKRYVESATRTLASYDRMRRVYTKANRMYTQMEKEFKQSKFKTAEYNEVKESWEKIEQAMTEIDSEASELSSCVEDLKSQLESLLGQ